MTVKMPSPTPAATRTFSELGRATLALLALCLLGGLVGCESAKVRQTLYAGILPKPDVIIVRTFAVTPADVRLDEGVVASAVRDSSGRPQSEEEIKVGRLVAEKLAATLVAELNKAGIYAVRDSAGVRATATSAILQGRFVTVDEGNQSARVWVGFGLGSSEIRTSVQVYQNGKLAAEGETATEAGLKPGMLVSIAGAGVTGSAAGVALGAAGQGYSEKFVATVEADASRTAKAVAERIRVAYVQRGWLAQ